DLAIEIVAGHPGFVARRHRPFARQPLEQATDLARVVRELAQLRLRVAGPQDPRDDLPLAVIERHVGSILLHDRPPFACGSVPPGTTHDSAIGQAGPSILSNFAGTPPWRVAPARPACPSLPVEPSTRVVANEPSRAKILQRLLDLRARVHHERTVAGDRLAQRARRREEKPA